MRVKLTVAACCVGLLLAARAIQAHHSFAAEFDAERPVQLRGVVTGMDWVNPHSWIHLDVKNDDGSVSKWSVEGATPNTLLRRGFTKSSLPVGTEIVVYGYRAKNGANRANGRDVMLPNGKRLFLGSSGTGAPADGKDASEK